MVGLIARLSRSFPLIIALAVLAIIIYFVVSWKGSPARAKEVLIKVFTVICSIITIFFALASLYAVLDGNSPMLELALSFAIVGLIGLAITLICRYFFKKHNPHYQWKRTAKATTTDGDEMRPAGLFWKIYDLLGMFRPKK